VRVTGAVNLGAYEFSLDWDPGVLDLVDVTNGAFLGSSGNTIVCSPPTVGSGTLTFDCSAVLGVLGPSGDGVLATIEFATVADGTTGLDLHDSVLTTLLLFQQPSTEVDGDVTVSSAQTLSFIAEPDTHVVQDDPTGSYGSDDELVVEGEAGKVARAFMDFNWSPVPMGSTIVSAEITMCIVNTTGGSAGRTHQIRRVSSGWDESTTWASQPTVYPAVSDSIIVPGSDQCVTFDVTADMQALVDGSPCFGWRLNDADESQASGSNTRYGASEGATSAPRPREAPRVPTASLRAQGSGVLGGPVPRSRIHGRPRAGSRGCWRARR
jgi:hypothetical protein